MMTDEDIGLIQICKLSSWQWPMRGQPIRSHITSPGHSTSEPGHQTQHITRNRYNDDGGHTDNTHRGPNLSYGDWDVTFLFRQQQSVSLKGPGEGFMLLCYQSIIEPIYMVWGGWSSDYSGWDLGARGVSEHSCYVMKCWLVVSCNLWDRNHAKYLSGLLRQLLVFV